MSLAEIEAELPRLTPEELRALALKSWAAFAKAEAGSNDSNECEEDDPLLLAALDEAVAHVRSHPGEGLSAAEVRARIAEWSSK